MHNSQPVQVSAREIRQVLSALSVTGPAELTPTTIARIIGPPVDARIVHYLLRLHPSLRDPQQVAEFIMKAKAEGQKSQHERVVQERMNGSNRW